MSEVSERYKSIANRFSERVGGVAVQAWDSPSPCADWTARDVVAHVVDTHRRVLATLEDTEPALVAPSEDLPNQWSQASSGVAASLGDSEQANRTVSGPFGEQPFESLVGRLLCADTLIHTWDLARATGQDTSLDETAVARALEFLTPIDEAVRRPGGFGPKIESQPGADLQTQLLNFSGRQT